MKLIDLDKDYITIQRWLSKYNCEISKEDLPKIGFMTTNACLFCMTTNSGVMFIEPIIANKDSKKEERSRELDSLFVAAFEYAKKMNYKKIWGLSFNDASIKRAMKNGFKLVKQPVLVEKGV
jgi:hypothetical protein